MSENLSDMMQDQTDEQPVSFPEEDLDLPEEGAASEESGESNASESGGVSTEEVANDANEIPVVSLGSWFERNGASFEEIKQVKLKVSGVDPKEDLVLTVPHESGEVDEDNQVKRRLMKIDNANTQPVLNIPGIDMKVYNNGGYRIVNQYNDQIFLKCYGVKTGLVVTFCLLVNDILVPYNRTKVSKSKDSALDITYPEPLTIQGKLAENLDKETLIVLYKQASKDIDDLNTVQDAIAYLTTKQDEIRDINHHIQIDDAIIRLIS